jgi:hypothetical protein
MVVASLRCIARGAPLSSCSQVRTCFLQKSELIGVELECQSIREFGVGSGGVFG